MISFSLLVSALLVCQCSAGSLEPRADTTALAMNARTFRGWTSWSLQAFKGPGYGADWFKEENIKRQADVLGNEFKQAGFGYFNLDSGWQDEKLDEFGRVQLSTVRFPSGIQSLQGYLETRGLSLGLYYLPGIDSRAVDNKTPVKGTKYTADQIVLCPTTSNSTNCKRPPANAFSAGQSLDFSHPGAQAYIDSIVDQLYSWKVTFVKYAGYIPGSSVDPNNADFSSATSAADLAAWRSAIDRLHQTKYSNQPKIWISAAWEIAKSQKDILKVNADSHRVAIDIAAYSTVMTTFDRVIRNARVAASWSSVDANRGGTVLDLDAILLADLSAAEAKTMVTLWALLGSPIYSGDDLTKLSQEKKALLTNPSVLDVAKRLTHNPARVLNYAEETTSSAQSRLARRDGNTESTAACDARVLQECHQMVCKSLMIDPSKVQSLYQASKLKYASSAKVTPMMTSGGAAAADPWERQVWYAELTQSKNPSAIYIGFVNAGQQLPTDGPAEITVDLKQLTLTRPMAKSYTISDLWTGKDVGTCSGGQMTVSSGTLAAHASVLYILKPN
ncbi:family 27 glycoside hydrolase [Melampsora larici-populina 98AG31]|uniref:alpha-galactosidase n=1 Tax=Melampsora larici-populina (strain 98AG31 / pathotype 3-4-7) TaxID=747676 RepID=F4SC40_MELLP|nr:family 27 glycoside hydrolase [Melampsora larici-populina 98AG31]EGF97786.1 family 27 glycoside hydrolase [Melampsora larici-populina 98AG31]